MYDIQFDPGICEACETLDCLVRCQHMTLDLDAARQERMNIINGDDSRVLKECITCYACEEYCPYDNHPFYLIVERQEQKDIWPVPKPLTKQQTIMMGPKGKIYPEKLGPPVIDMCYFPMLVKQIRGKLFEGCSTIVGSDLFCNIMWLHFAKNSVIRERVPMIIDNLWTYYLKDNHIEELICYHDECYATYTHLAPSFGMDVPFRPIHLFEYLTQRLDQLKDQIRPIGMKVAYQRPCSNRLIPETQHWVDDIFERIGVERVDREYDRENALCCGAILRAQQRDDLADDLQKRNIDDMKASGANVCVFNCPFCIFTLGETVAKEGMMPLLMSDLCQFALGEGKPMWG
ncbi:MAG: (Fe-S)-binding protein [Deltaproteobacteria bacterium]|nr:(Fe-S)-binding protein [Deltaproteobacteria bacterium]